MRKYVVRRDQLVELRIINHRADLEQPDERGRPMLPGDLSRLLDQEYLMDSRRCHALIVPTRRRSIALLVDRVEDAYHVAESTIQPMPKLLNRQLLRPWFSGVYVRDDDQHVLLVLDLRQIAQDVFMLPEVREGALPLWNRPEP